MYVHVIDIYIYIHTYIYGHTCIYTHTRTHSHRRRLNVCTSNRYIYLHTYKCTWTYIYIQSHTHAHTHTGSHTHAHTHTITQAAPALGKAHLQDNVEYLYTSLKSIYRRSFFPVKIPDVYRERLLRIL